MSQDSMTGVREVADGVYMVDAPFWGFPLSLYFVRAGRRWSVVDTGISTTPAESIVPFLDEYANGVEDLDFALLTHGHVDHIGGNGALEALAPQVRFALHERDCGWAENVTRHYQQLYAVGEPEAWTPDAEFESAIRGAIGAPAAIDRILADRDTIDLGEGRVIEVHHVGGHSPGHVVFHDVNTNTVFCGDTLQANGGLNSETGKRDFPMYRTVRDYRAALEYIRGLGAERLCSAHNGTIEGEAVEPAIDASLEWCDGFHELVREIARRERTMTLAQAVEAVLAERPEHAQLLQVYVTTAEHLDELVRTGDLHPEIADGIKHWTITSS